MEAAEDHQAGEQEESQSDFHNSGFDPLHGQELGPIELYFFGGLEERPGSIYSLPAHFSWARDGLGALFVLQRSQILGNAACRRFLGSQTPPGAAISALQVLAVIGTANNVEA
jgi:hypothetical protein